MSVNGRHVMRAVALSFALASASLASEPAETLTDYSISTWKLKDGLPSSVVWSIAQDTDGYLWLGTNSGLVRFDGVRFVSWDEIGRAPLPKQRVKAALVSRDGSLWIGYGEAEGGVTRIRHGEALHYGPGDGLSRGPVTEIIEDPAGTVWVSNAAGLFRFSGQAWEGLPPAVGVPERPIQTALIDRTGNVLVATPSAIYRLAADGEVFDQVEVSDGFRGRMISEAGSGTLWVTDPVSAFRRLGEHATHADRGLGMRLLHDRAGHLWVATLGQGLWRVASGRESAIQKSTTRSGLSNDVVLSLFEDRDGNIWAGTNEGVSRLTPHKVRALTDVGVVTALAKSPDGGVWLAKSDELIRLDGTAGKQTAAVRVAWPGVRALHVDRSGTLWALTGRELARIVNGRAEAVRFPARQVPLSQLRYITSSASGAIWISDESQGLFSWQGGQLLPFAPPEGLAAGSVAALQSDSAGRVWIAVTNGTLIMVGVDGTVEARKLPPLADDSRPVVLYEDSEHAMWLGGFGWLSRYANGRFDTVTRAMGLPAGYVKAFGEADGELWVAADPGIVRLTRQAFDQTIREPSRRLRYSLYDTSDGVAGTPVLSGNAVAPRMADGRLWFVTSTGVTIVDPSVLRGGSSAARVRIEAMTADGRTLGDLSSATLPPDSTRIEIAYTAVNLTAPHKLRFRYRLTGFDTDWRDAGARRTAFYTNLPPRQYRFDVAVQNEDGSWAGSSQPLAFTIRRAFYQTWSFYLLCAMALGGAAWAVWQLRLFQLRREFSLILGERLRFSHELHDTALQDLVGVGLQLDALSSTLASSPEVVPTRLAHLRRLVGEHIHETRRTIRQWRSPLLDTRGLASALRQFAETATDEAGVALAFMVSGTWRKAAPQAEDELLRIGQEAIYNAVRHASARTIHVSLHYDRRSITLRVDDDGHGFDVDATVDTGHLHYGLRSMKERAERAGGSVRLTSLSGNGTHVEAVVPR